MSNQTNTSSSIVSNVWAFCNTLRDDGVGYGDYLEQLTYLLFLKMADGTAGCRRTVKCPSLQNTIGKPSPIKAVMH
jgi:hypothetical protein